MLSLSQSLDAQLRAAMQRAFPEVDAVLDRVFSRFCIGK